jgi:type III secretion system low calcium response chaperone LcrH/SycD
MKDAKEAMRKAVDKAAEKVKGSKEEAFKKNTNAQIPTTVKDMLGISEESIESLYSQAYLLYNTGRYRDAIQVFRLLTMLNPMESKYTMGLAASLHMLKEYKGSAAMYTLVSILDPENPIPHYHASDCYIQMGDKLSSLAMLEMAIKKSGSKVEFSALKKRAEITLDAIKKELMQTKSA